MIGTILIAIVLIVCGVFALAILSRRQERAITKIASTALPKATDSTALDRHWSDIGKDHDSNHTALALVQSNMDAFALRVSSARAAGRSLDLMYYM